MNTSEPENQTPQKPARKGNGARRRVLLILGPAVVAIVGGWMYLTGGRYIATDNAYVKTDIISIAPEVSGIIRTVDIDENAPVTKGETLFTIDDTNYTIAVAMAQANLNSAATQIEAMKARYQQKVQDIASAQADLSAMNLATTGNMWIEANYKETELTNMQPGQKVEIEVDTYPHMKWEGTVQSISPATESEFSILPAQNATGNWVKVVQRIPVRIAIDQSSNSPQLRAGMSSHVTVDTEQWPHLPTAFAADGKKRTN